LLHTGVVPQEIDQQLGNGFGLFLLHPMSMLMDLRAAKALTKRALELNECDYCVAHHKPFLAVEGISAAGADRLLDWRDHPELDERDKLVVEYAIAA
jgi:AhpD family alkylhydroperoxidase